MRKPNYQGEPLSPAYEHILTVIQDKLEWRGMTQTELAKRCNVSKDVIHRLVNGYRTGYMELFIRVCTVLEIKMEELEWRN